MRFCFSCLIGPHLNRIIDSPVDMAKVGYYQRYSYALCYDYFQVGRLLGCVNYPIFTVIKISYSLLLFILCTFWLHQYKQKIIQKGRSQKHFSCNFCKTTVKMLKKQKIDNHFQIFLLQINFQHSNLIVIVKFVENHLQS